MTKEEVMAMCLSNDKETARLNDEICALQNKKRELRDASVVLWNNFYKEYIDKKVRLTTERFCRKYCYEGYFGGCESLGVEFHFYPIVYKLKKNGDKSKFKESIWEYVENITNIELI